MKQLQRRKAKEEAREEANDLVLKQWENFATKADIVILYTLHKEFGFGKERCERFYRKMIENQISMIEQYRTSKDDDDTHYWVMEERLKNANIDVKALQEEVERIPIPDDKSYTERNTVIQEWKVENQKE